MKKHYIIGFSVVLVALGIVTMGANVNTMQAFWNTVWDQTNDIRVTFNAFDSTSPTSDLPPLSIADSVLDTTNNAINLSISGGIPLNSAAITGVTSLTASATVQAEQLTSTDDITATDTITGAVLASTADTTVGDDLTVGGWWTIPPTTVAVQNYTISSTGKASSYIWEYSDTGEGNMNLPDAPADGTIIYIKDGDKNAGTNNLFIAPNGGGSDTIEETTIYTFDANSEAVVLQYDAGNTDWVAIGGFGE